MVHPIFSVLIARPELIMDHVAGYAALAQEEASAAGVAFTRRAIAWVVAVLAFVMFLLLAGVAAMLAVMHNAFHWILVLVPAAALLACVLAWNAARRRLPAKAFSQLRAQIDADAQVLRTAGVKP